MNNQIASEAFLDDLLTLNELKGGEAYFPPGN
jgi:hypothetical protein